MAKATRANIKARAKIDINFLARLAAPEIMEADFPALYIAAARLIFEGELSVKEMERLLLGLPRGHGKSFFAKVILLWVVLFTKRRFIFIIAASGDLAEDIVADVWDFLHAPDIMAVWGSPEANKIRDTQERKEFYYCDRDIIIQGKGAGSKVRGKSRKAVRPDFYFLDDMQTRENSKSPTLSVELYKWMIGTLLKGRDPKSCQVIFCGNKYPYEGSIIKKLEMHPSWTTFVVGALLQDGEALWPAVRSKESLMAEFRDDLIAGMASEFIAEMLNADEAGLASGIRIDMIPESLKEYTATGRFIIIDMATDKNTPDQAVIMVNELALEYENKPVIRHIEELKVDHIKLASRAIALALEYQVPLITYEDVGMQHVMLAELRRQLNEHSILGIDVQPVAPKGVNKNLRIINYFFKLLMTGETRMHESVYSQVVSQISFFDPSIASNLDDIIDTAAYIPQVMQEYRNKIILPLMGQVYGQDEYEETMNQQTSF